MDLDLDGDAALLTASSSGLGKASARALAAEGVDVVLNGRDEDRLAAAVADVSDAGDGDVVGHPGDVTDPSDVRAMVDRTVEEFGRLDHLVTSAGGPPRLRFGEASDDDWYDAFDLLVMGVVRAVRAAEDHLRSGGGSVVAITSVSSREPIPSNVLSSCLRTPVVNLVAVLSRDLAPAVRVNTVMPGLFQTPRRADPGDAGLDAAADVPLDRIGGPEELGAVVALLCSPRSGYVTGASIPVDGGVTNGL